MADRKISDLTALTTPASGDYLPIVDISESAAASKNKRVTIQSLFQGIPVNVGIGTSSPAHKLDVAGGVNSTGLNVTGFGGFFNAANKFGVDNNAGVTRMYSSGPDASTRGSYDFRATDSVGTLDTSRMVIDSSGRVGVGTTSPAALLSVSASSPTGLGSRLNIENTESSSTIDIIATGTAFSQSNWATVTDGAIIRTGANGSGGLALQAGSNAPISFWGSTTERARFDSSGRLLVGTSTAVSVNSLTAGLELHSLTTSNGASASIVRLGNDGTAGPQLNLGKSRSGTLSPGGIVAENDVLGEISFNGDDGTDINSQAARIRAEVDGTPGANDMPGRLVFSTTADGASSPTERMRITSGGRILAGTTALLAANYLAHFSSSYGGGIWAEATGGGDACYVSKSPGDSVGYHYVGLNNAGTIVYGVLQSGNVQNTNNSYGAISDLKLKENIVDANSQWDDLKALQVRKYNFKEGQTHTQIGLVAQEVELVSPGLVSESPDRDEEGNDLGTVTKSVNYSVLYMKAVKALQEAMERIETLEAKVAALEAS